ncbi:mechanosensitive ion channel domain-containing protein [Novosphingobium sp. SG707]|uniref:mechanosensitive ion channel family protein n=1 Tax=Novosphingobium sp. SG707 TaxID=2586996 RepID=UPI0014488AC8|nr:mechanosensitive ion channel domain-containing protein [Novosphingobium sp. SG707]NKJ01734.1 small-conductance mechanosensitive channel [Novosphingobium sp. SG707]
MLKISSVLSSRARRLAGFALMGLAEAPLSAATISGAGDNLPVLLAAQRDLERIWALFERQITQPFRTAFGLPTLLVAVGMALLLAWPLRIRMLHRLAFWLRGLSLDLRVAIGLKAVATVFVTTMLFYLAEEIGFGGLDLALPLLPESEVMVAALSMGIGVAGLGLGVGRALESPEDPAWRPVDCGVSLGKYPLAAGIMLGATNVIDQTARLIHANNSSWTIAQGVIAIIETMIIGHFLLSIAHSREPREEEKAGPGKNPAGPAVFGVTALLWVILAVGAGAFLAGHIRLSMLILQELLWAGLVLTMAWLVTGFIDAALAQWSDSMRSGKAVVTARSMRAKQLALLASAAFTVLVWLFAIGLVAAPLHGDNAVVVEQIRPLPLLNSLRSLDLSPRSLSMALFVLIAGIALTRVFRRWLETRFLPSTSLDIGVRTSLVTGLTYVGTLIALLGATNMLGLQLEKVTLIASALSVGVGFGLQSIIQNFVSGVILLIERPVKPGDWVSVSGAEGTIRRIRVRATELATADGGIAIVPNSSFISSNVANRADTLMSSRLDLTLTVSGGQSVAAARDVVLELVRGFMSLRDQPAPQIYLKTLGEAEWVFDLVAYAKPGMSVAQTRSDLLFWLAGQQQGRDIRIRSS